MILPHRFVGSIGVRQAFELYFVRTWVVSLRSARFQLEHVLNLQGAIYNALSTSHDGNNGEGVAVHTIQS